MKRTISLLLVFCMLLSLISFKSFAIDSTIANAKEVYEATNESIAFRTNTNDEDYDQERWLKYTPLTDSIYRIRLDNQHSSSSKFDSWLKIYDPTDEDNQDYCFMYAAAELSVSFDEDFAQTDVFLKAGITYYILIEASYYDTNKIICLDLSINSVNSNIQLGQVLNHTFNVVRDGTYEGDSDINYFFKPDKSAYYSFTATLKSKITNTTLAKSITEGLEIAIWDSYDGDTVSSNEYWSVKDYLTTTTAYLVAGRQYKVNLGCWKSGTYTIEFSSSTHTKHSYKTTYCDKATLDWDGTCYQECIYCEKERELTVPHINRKSIKLSASAFYYDGKVKTPTVAIKDHEGNNLKPNTDYTLTYAKGRKVVGIYKLKITFKGKYSGIYNLSFKIIPRGTSISKVAAGKKSFVVQWKKQATQTTGYQLQYSTNAKFTGAKTVTIKSPKILKSTVKNLSSKKVYFVRIRTYKTVSRVNYFSGWSKAVKVKTK